MHQAAWMWSLFPFAPQQQSILLMSDAPLTHVTFRKFQHHNLQEASWQQHRYALLHKSKAISIFLLRLRC